MGTIQKLAYLEDTKAAIGNAIAAKGGSVTGKTFRQYATEIENLPSGGGGTPIAVSKDVSDYTGGTTFNFLAQITDVNFPSGITSIRDYAFQYCSGLTSVTIPEGVTSIGRSAFTVCSSLTSITIPNSVTNIKYLAFNSCRSLSSVTCLATTPPKLENYTAFNNTNNCPIYVPAESVDTYKAASQWSSLSSRIQAIPSE